jgi:hypothetical protein
VSCPHCRRTAGYHSDRERTLVGLFGTVSYPRAYYYCRPCGRGLAPFDEQAGVGGHQLTPAAERLTALAGGVCDGFEKASELLAEMAGVRLAESTVERTTEGAGARIAGLLGEGVTFGPDASWAWRPDAKGRSVAYVTLDATGVRQQGPGGTAAEGRMAYVGAVYNPAPDRWLLGPRTRRPAMQARYLSGLYALGEMGPLMRRLAASVGMDQAEVWVALTDGGAGLEEFMRMNFNRSELVVILDFYPAASYGEGLATALPPADAEAARGQAEAWCRLLKEEGGAAALAVLREWDWPARRSAALREQLGEVLGYFERNLHRMDYPEYQAEGWQIGSGVVESACKTVVGQRLKGAGMRWGADGAHALCHVRALYRSEKGQWEAFWRRHFTRRTPVHQLN